MDGYDWVRETGPARGSGTARWAGADAFEVDDLDVIDLDLRGAPSAVPPVERHRRRWWLPAAVATLAALALLGGGTRSTPLTPRFALPDRVERGEVIGDVLYAETRSPHALLAYRLPGGRHLWSRATGVRAPEWERYGDTIVITMVDGEGVGTGVEVIDGPTGRTLWHRPGVSPVGGTGGVVALRRSTTGAAPATLVGVDVRTGAERWSHQLAAGTVTYPVPGWRGVVGGTDGTATVEVSGPDGETRHYDVATGQSVAAGPGVTGQPSVIDPGATGPGAGGAGGSAASCRPYSAGEPAATGRARVVCLPSGVVALTPGAAVAVLPQDIARLVAEDLAWSDGRGLPGWNRVGTTRDGRRQVVVQQGTGNPHPAVATFDPESERLSVVGRLPSGRYRPMCRTSDRYLLCVWNFSLAVWRLPPGAAG